ncbi:MULTISPECIES: sigma-70 family RNA polymerase sigma factor [Selenomonas]|uniref:Sigma-70 family RNA polymerase sigma factor n=1 Tax=Selenomonas ruminis TaxID=2593411 RepID=A0A5D6W865_9FIRM|nr:MULTISPECIES: sigma-70 family RNA polymerase sigma factor [unclassified Selenomonas]MBQ1868268.1 sigma-70 family RNA polymerase sigma factor [Selenomonas sp.]TYZ24016.1 sigma-70 family RNA polymerase sigma factor [Selenomonas sp. mPRGC5]
MQFEQYIAELSRVRLLAPAQEKVLWRKFKEEGDEEARRLLIESYQPLVFKQALPYRQMQTVMDIVQEGTVGLIEAVEHYEPEREVAFSLFAVHRIRGRMLNFLQKEGDSDVACMDALPVGGGDSLKDNLADMSPSVMEQAESHELAHRLHQAMDRLPAKEKAVLEGLYMQSEAAGDMAEGLQVSISHVYRLQKNGIRRVRGMLSRFMHNW